MIASLDRIKQNLELIDHDTHNLVNQISINNNHGINTNYIINEIN